MPEPAESRATSGLITTANVTALEYCHQATNWLTQVKLLGSYNIPRIDVHGQRHAAEPAGPADPGELQPADRRARRRPSAGRSRAAPRTSRSGLIDPGTIYGDRLNQVDFRVSKMLRFDRTRTTVSLDFYNMMNVSTVLAQNNTFGPVWLRPSSIFPARFAKVSLQFDF